MKLSSETYEILRNFGTINGNILVREGNVIRSLKNADDAVAKAEITDVFPRSFGIYDINEMLSCINVFDDPNLDFKEDHMVISDTSGAFGSIRYYYTPDKLLKIAPDDDPKMPESEISFVLSSKRLGLIKKSSSVLGLEDLTVFPSSDKTVTLKVTEVKKFSDEDNDTLNSFSDDVDAVFNEQNFKFIFKISNLKMIDGDYEVKISSKKIAHFRHLQRPIDYWVASELNSKYGEN